MKKIILIGLILLALTTTAGMAQQAGEKESSSPMQGMMQEMKKEGKSDEGANTPMKGMQDMMKGDQTGGGMPGMGGTAGMMGMMKMIEQCSAMMESIQHSSKETQESPK